jgi:hypothetical protein
LAQIIGSHPPNLQQESSPYFPDIPDLVADSATEDVSQKYETDFQSGPTAEAADLAPAGFVISDTNMADTGIRRPQPGQVKML